MESESAVLNAMGNRSRYLLLLDGGVHGVIRIVFCFGTKKQAGASVRLCGDDAMRDDDGQTSCFLGQQQANPRIIFSTTTMKIKIVGVHPPPLRRKWPPLSCTFVWLTKECEKWCRTVCETYFSNFWIHFKKIARRTIDDRRLWVCLLGRIEADAVLHYLLNLFASLSSFVIYTNSVAPL